MDTQHFAVGQAGKIPIGLGRRTTAKADAILSIGRLICKLNIREIVTATSLECAANWGSPIFQKKGERKEMRSPFLGCEKWKLFGRSIRLAKNKCTCV